MHRHRPTAPRVEHREVRHGATVIDDYFWLREKSNPKVTEYLEAENAYTAAHDQGPPAVQRRALQGDAGPHQADRPFGARRRAGGYLYYSRTEEGKQYPIQCRRKGNMEAPEEVLLDLNELGKDKKFVGLGGFVVSDDQNLVAYTIDYTGFRQFALQVKDLRTGQTLPDTTERVTSRRLGRRQQDALPGDRGRRHQAQRQALAPRPGHHEVRRDLRR